MGRKGKQRIPQKSKRSRRGEKEAAFAGLPSRIVGHRSHLTPQHLKKSARGWNAGAFALERKFRREEHILSQTIGKNR